MARIRVARGSKTNLPGALDENTLLYGEMYWEREQLDTTDGVLYMGKPDGVEDGENDKDPLAIAGARAMRSLYFQGLWDPSSGAYPTEAKTGDIYVAEADGTGAASTFKYGDWAVCIGNDGGSSQWLKAINQAITTEDPLGHDRNPLQLNEGVLKLKYDPATLKLNANGELTVSHTEVYTTETDVQISAGQPVALDSAGKAIVADCTDVDTAIVIGLAVNTAAPGDFVTVQRSDLVSLSTDSGDLTFAPFEIGAPVYLYVNGTYTQDVEDISPGFVLQQCGIAQDTDVVDVHIGTPFQIDASSDIYYIPLTQVITAGDTVHAPSSKAVYDIVQQLTNIDTQLVSKTETETQQIASSLSILGNVDVVGDISANDIRVAAESLYLGEMKLSNINGVLQITNDPEGSPEVLNIVRDSDLLAIDQNIIPDLDITRNLGDGSHQFNEVHAKSIKLLGQTITYANAKITYNGSEILTTANQGSVVNSLIPDADGTRDLGSEVNNFGTLYAKNAIIDSDISVKGNLTISGTTTTINTTEVNIADNLIQVNSNQEGTPSDTLVGGIEINRGTSANYRFIFEEVSDTFKIGEIGSLQAVATRKGDMGIDSNVPIWSTALNQFQNTSVTISGSTITGSLVGNASSATKLQTARTIGIDGDITATAVAFDGTDNITITAAVNNNSHTHTSANISDATNASIANMIVKRDANGDFSAGTISAALTGNASSATTANKVRNVNFHADAVDPTGVTRLNMDGEFYASKVYNAVWNDIADFIPVGPNTTIEYGKVFVMDEEENYGVSQNYCPSGIIGIASDTYGFGVGQKQDVKQIPIAIGGFVLAHVDKKYAVGTPLTATADGKLTEIKITDKRDYPERIVATYWKPETAPHWNGVLVNGRHWVKVK